MFLLVRTRREGKPQTGITFLLMDMDVPGVEVDPIINLAGEHELNQVFFTDVRVPRANRVGEENDGWSVAKYLLEFERGGGSSAGTEILLVQIRDMIEANDPDNAALRAHLADLERRFDAIRMTERRIMSALESGGSPGQAASMLKIVRSELRQDISEFAYKVAGPYAFVFQNEARLPSSNVEPVGPEEYMPLMGRYMTDRASSIAGGSNEVQRDIIAKQVLRL